MDNKRKSRACSTTRTSEKWLHNNKRTIIFWINNKNTIMSCRKLTWQTGKYFTQFVFVREMS
jgi:hypothetical protein